LSNSERQEALLREYTREGQEEEKNEENDENEDPEEEVSREDRRGSNHKRGREEKE